PQAAALTPSILDVHADTVRFLRSRRVPVVVDALVIHEPELVGRKGALAGRSVEDDRRIARPGPVRGGRVERRGAGRERRAQEKTREQPVPWMRDHSRTNWMFTRDECTT